MRTGPVAVFDSGLGGLSVVRHLRQLLPGEDIVYFGDTARVPYGSKSRPTVVSFALDDARFLMQFEPKLMVVACNTASALAMDALTAELPVPVIGVVEPGAQAAARVADGSTIAVVGTEATIASGAYPFAIHAIAPGQSVVTKACPLLVPLVEEGRTARDPIVRLVIADYMGSLRDESIRVLVLGCTHYPLLRESFREVLGPGVHIIDSGREASLAVQHALGKDMCLSASQHAGTLHCYVSDNPARFRRIGSRFLEHEIEHVEFVPPERYIASAMPEC